MSSARRSSSATCATRCSHQIRRTIGTATFLSPTGVSLLSLLQVFHIPFTHVSVFSIKQPQCKYPHPQCNTHPLAVRTVTARAVKYRGDIVPPVFVFHSPILLLQWWHIFPKLSRSAKNTCRECSCIVNIFRLGFCASFFIATYHEMDPLYCEHL
jgi:hypothetical protein